MKGVTLPPAFVRLSAALERPECYPHRTSPRITRIDTHISSVYLTGSYAYKVKKPVDLGFLNFTTLEARRHYCEEELRLNRRLAPDVYLDIVEIKGSPEAPRIGGTGPLVDYAVRMREFPQEALASNMLARGELTRTHVDELAARIAAFHADAPFVTPGKAHGSPATVFASAIQNLEQIAALEPPQDMGRALEALRQWTDSEFRRCRDELQARYVLGCVRECHGDLHLGNVVLLGSRLVPFDCIEFNADLRWVDVTSECAFLAMDLLDRGAPALAWRFLNAYLAASGDYSGMRVLRFYLVYRALVRAKVHLMRARQTRDTREASRLAIASADYVALARRLAAAGPRVIVGMHGLSGTGKTTVAAALAESIGAVHLRSDVERKRLQGLKPLERSGSALAEGLYRREATSATYRRLHELASEVIAAGYPVIVDAAYLRRAQREDLEALASRLDARLLFVTLRADPAVLRERILRRSAGANDASEATLEVLEHQIATREPFGRAEAASVIALESGSDTPGAAIERLRGELGLPVTSQLAKRKLTAL